MKRIVCLISFLLLPKMSFAAQEGEWFLTPYASAGYNTVQGTHFRLGVDGGMYVTEFIRAGVGAYYVAGEKSQYDREIGAGPFVGFAYPLTSFLIFTAREDIDYVDARFPTRVTSSSGVADSYVSEAGVISATSAGIHVFLTPNFAVSAGYRYVMGLTNSRLDDGRSATYFGFAFGI